MTPPVDLVPAQDAPVDGILAVLSSAFGRQFTREWFHWKHREGPWGPSIGCAAVDITGVVGVRLLLPWQLRCGNQTILVMRAVEASTAPQMRGKGVFRLMNEVEMRQLIQSGSPPVVFSTANSQSRPVYESLGWKVLAPIAHCYRPVAAHRHAGSVSDASIPAAAQVFTGSGDNIHTDWSPRSLRWRIDPRSGRSYRVIRLTDATQDSGLIYRCAEGRRRRSLLPLIAWGPPRERDALITGAARMEGVRLILEPSGPGAASPRGRLSVRRGQSVLVVWDGREEGALMSTQLTQREGWRLSMADLESVL